MQENGKKIVFDPSDLDGMIALMEKHGGDEMPIDAVNEKGENVLISIMPTSITTRTFQKNGWTRVNKYTYEDGDIYSEEMYEK